jgi:hypothetical protein
MALRVQLADVEASMSAIERDLFALYAKRASLVIPERGRLPLAAAYKFGSLPPLTRRSKPSLMNSTNGSASISSKPAPCSATRAMGAAMDQPPRGGRRCWQPGRPSRTSRNPACPIARRGSRRAIGRRLRQSRIDRTGRRCRARCPSRASQRDRHRRRSRGLQLRGADMSLTRNACA